MFREPHPEKPRARRWRLLLLAGLISVLSACGGGGGGGGDDGSGDDPTSGNRWNEMHWDQGRWS